MLKTKKLFVYIEIIRNNVIIIIIKIHFYCITIVLFIPDKGELCNEFRREKSVKNNSKGKECC